MDTKTKNVTNISKEEKKQLRININEIRRLTHAKGEKKDVVKKIQRVFLTADKWKAPPIELTDLLDDIFDLYPQAEPNQNEDYLRFLGLLMEKKALEHPWIRNYYKSYKPNALIDITLRLLENGQYELAMGLLETFKESVFKVDNLIKMLRVKKLHEDFAWQLMQKVPDVNDLNKCLSNQNISINVIKTFNGTYKKGKELWPVHLGKKRIMINIERNRSDHQKYINKLKDSYLDVYRVLYSQEAFFYLSMSPEKRQLEALPRATCLFIALETFMKKMIRLPPNYSTQKNKPGLGDYIRYLEENPKKLTKNWSKYYWKNSYVHRNAIADKGKRYSLNESLNQFGDWRNGNIQTTLPNWEFVQNVVRPFTYELLCDLMDAFGVVPS